MLHFQFGNIENLARLLIHVISQRPEVRNIIEYDIKIDMYHSNNLGLRAMPPVLEAGKTPTQNFIL